MGPSRDTDPQASSKAVVFQWFWHSWCSNIVPSYVVALWEAFYIENKCFYLDTLRAPNRSPTPISKSNDFQGQSDDIWGARSPPFRPILGVPGVRAGFTNTYFLAFLNGHHA